MATPKKLAKTVSIQHSKPVLKPKLTKPKVEFDPNKHLVWSTKKMVWTIVICVIISLILVFGFLASAQFRKEQIPDEAKPNNKASTSNTKHYSNNYWGIEFDYPNNWTQPIGSYADGEYYFSSQAINFIGELESGEALITLKTFNNWNNLPFDEWMKSQQWSFIPAGQLSTPTSSTINGLPAQRYTLHLKTPQNNTSLWDIVVISRSTATKYVFILETDQDSSQQKYRPYFDSILSSIAYRKVESNPSGN